MAIYRPRRSPWPLAAGLAAMALIVGFGIGYATFGARPPDLDAAASAVRDSLMEARGLLEVSAIEYREAAPDGAIVSEGEYAAAGDALSRARSAFDVVADPLRTIAPDRAAALEDGFEAIATLFDELAPPDAVDAAVESQIELLQP